MRTPRFHAATRTIVRRMAVALMCSLLSLAAPDLVFAQHSSHASSGGSENLGQVNFSVGCNAAAQKEFNVAVAYYHSFDWSQIPPVLQLVRQADPSCGMAYWLQALAMLDNPFVWPGIIKPQAMIDGPLALESARKAGLKSQRERDYVDALAVFFKDQDTLDHPTRAKALELALEKVAKRYPEDTEASVIYALILSSNWNPADKQYVNQLKAAKILEPIFKQQPQHPGVAHYLIHSYDYPPIAKEGLDAARKYAKIAPNAPHALHMPSHIFTLLGLWPESISSNIAAAGAAREGTQQAFHAYEYMVYAYLQLGDIDAAKRVLEQQRSRKLVDEFGAAYSYASIPARIAIETNGWEEARDLPLIPASDAYPWKKYPQAEAINAFARGIGAAMTNDPLKANVEVRRLESLRDAAGVLKLPYWVDQIDIQAEVVRGLAMAAEGKREEGIAVVRKAADREDASEKHVVTPGPLISARAMLAIIVDQYGDPVGALTEFEKGLKDQPNRNRLIAGAAQSAERAGNAEKAAYYSNKLLELTKR